MTKVVPQKSGFEKAEAYDKIKTDLTVAIAVGSIFVAVWTKMPFSCLIIDNIFAVLILILTGVREFYDCRYNSVYREAEQIRRDAFLDNAFGSKIANVEVVGYYDTDDITLGMKKVLANLHDDSFVSSKVLSRMLEKKEQKFVAAGVFVAIIALFNFAGIQFVVAVTDVFLTISIFRDYFELKNLKTKIENIETECRNLWMVFENENNAYDNRVIAKILQLFVRYETALAYASIMFDSDEFEKINKPSMEEWSTIKKRYNMQNSKQNSADI